MYDRLVADLTSAVSTIALANADDSTNEIGPLISLRQRDRVASFVNRARELNHVQITTGGEAITFDLIDRGGEQSISLADLRTAHCRTDEDYAQFCRNVAGTNYHPTSSCRMGPDAGAVVDARLRVHGVAGLRVVDASVMPGVVGGNTNAPVIMMAEKAVDMILAARRVAA